MKGTMKGLQISAEFKPRAGYKPTQREIDKQMALQGNMIWYNPKMELVEKPIPTPKDDEVLLKVGAAGVCGSDTMFLESDEENYCGYIAHCAFPCIIGHEYSGEVVAVGKHVKTIKTGDLVVAETMNWCGECSACRKGYFNQCENLEEIGFTLDGGFAEYLVAKEKFCFKVNKFVDVYKTKERALEVAALIEPAAVAYNGIVVRGGGFQPGSYVAVYGCGPIGLSSIGIVSAAGAAKVIAFDFFDERLELAKKMGATAVYNTKKLQQQGKTMAEIILAETDGEGAAMQIEATENSHETICDMERALAVGARVVQIGINFNRTALSTFNFQTKAAAYSFHLGSSGHGIWSNVIKLIASGKLDMSNVINKKYSLDDAIAAITAAKNGAPGKQIVTPHW